jgi:hypothetical protein
MYSINDLKNNMTSTSFSYDLTTNGVATFKGKKGTYSAERIEFSYGPIAGLPVFFAKQENGDWVASSMDAKTLEQAVYEFDGTGLYSTSKLLYGSGQTVAKGIFSIGLSTAVFGAKAIAGIADKLAGDAVAPVKTVSLVKPEESAEKVKFENRAVLDLTRGGKPEIQIQGNRGIATVLAYKLGGRAFVTYTIVNEEFITDVNCYREASDAVEKAMRSAEINVAEKAVAMGGIMVQAFQSGARSFADNMASKAATMNRK